MTSSELLRLLRKNGWKYTEASGSHYHLEKEGKVIILAFHGKKELPTGIVNSILKQANLK